MSNAMHRVGRWLVIVGVASALLSHGKRWLEKVEANWETVEMSHVLLSGDAGRLEETDVHLSELLAVDPRDVKTAIWWARVQMVRGELSDLVPLLESGRLADSERGRLMLVGLGSMFLQDLDITHFRMAWQQAGVWRDPPQRPYFRLLNTGKRAIQEGRSAEALELFRILETWRPNEAEVHEYLAYILRHSDDLSGAIKEEKQVLALEPESFWAHIRLGELYMQTGRLSEAQQQFEHAAKIHPDHPRNEVPVIALAKVFRLQGRLHEAARVMETFLERNPDNVPVLVTLGWHYYNRLGREDDACELIQRALREDGDPDYLARGHDILASIASSHGDTESAAWHAEEARRIRKTYEQRQ